MGVYGTTTLNLAGGYYYPDLKCNITAQSGLTAGKYRVRFVYTTDDDQYWHLIGDGNYTNDGYFTVSGGNATYDLQMYSPIHISSNPVPYNSAFYFTDSILNNGTKEYNGYIGVAIYKSDGTLVNIFGITQLDLESYYFYKNFKCDIPSQNGLSAGHYYARYAYLNSEDNYWYLIGNGDYYNYLDFTISDGTPSKPFTLSVYSDNTNMGSVSGGCRFYGDTTVTIRANANPGYHFTRWNDGNTNSSRVVTVKSDTTFIAYFEASAAKMYKITVLSIDTNMGTVRGEGTFKENSQTTIMATAKKGYQFVQWQDGNNQRIRTITVTEDATYTAYFDIADDIKTIENDSIQIYAFDKEIVIRNAEQLPVRVSDVTGRLWFMRDYIPTCEFRIPINESGIYYVQVGANAVKKVIIKR